MKNSRASILRTIFMGWVLLASAVGLEAQQAANTNAAQAPATAAAITSPVENPNWIRSSTPSFSNTTGWRPK